MRYYLTPEPDPQSDEKIADNRVYRQLSARGFKDRIVAWNGAIQ